MVHKIWGLRGIVHSQSIFPYETKINKDDMNLKGYQAMTLRILKNRRLHGKAALIASTAIVSAFMTAAPSAYAQMACTPMPTAGDDTITCTGDTGFFQLDADDGNDTINVNGANPNSTPNFDVNGNDGNDTITITNSFVDDVRGDNVASNDDGGDDVITITNSTIRDDVSLSGGNNRLTATDSSIGGDISSRMGNQIITLTRVTDLNFISVDDGNDTITLVETEISGNVNLRDGNDTLTATGGRINGSITSTGNGDDTVSLTNVADVNSINITNGSDTVVLDNTRLSGTLNVGANNMNDGDDSVTLRNNASIGSIALGNGDDTVNSTMSEIRGSINLGNGNDSVTAMGGRINGSITSTDGDDTVSLTNVVDVNSINITRGADTVVLDNTQLSGTLNVGSNTMDDGDDSVTLRNGVELGSLTLGNGNDTLNSTDSEIRGSVSLGSGNDTVIATNGIINGSINSTDGDDSITLTNVMDVNSINISRGADTVVLDNTVLSGSLDVGLNTDNDGADSVTVRNGAMIGGIVDLGFDDDTFTASTNAMIDGNVSTGAGNDTVNVLSGATTEDIITGDGNDIVTVNGGRVGNTPGTFGISTGDGDDVVTLNGTVNGFVDLGDDNDTIVLDASTIINTTNQNSLAAGDGSDNVTINGGTFNGIWMNPGVSDFEVTDELVINGGTINGQVRLGGGNDLLTVNGGTLVEGIGIVGQGFQQETIVINDGFVGTQPGNGHSIFTGEDEDQVGIFGGDVQSRVVLAAGDDLLVIDANADEYTTAETQVFVPNGFAAGNPNQTHDPATNDLDHTITGSDLIATPTEFIGGSGDDVAEIFDLVETENLDFESFNDVNFYGLSVTLRDDAAGEAQQEVDTFRLLRGSTLTQITGRLDITGEPGASGEEGGPSTLTVDGTSMVILQDGVVDDRIYVQNFNPLSGSVLAVDVDVTQRGYAQNDSDFIFGTVHTPESGAIVNVNVLGNADLSGSRRIVDGGADVNDPGVGAVVNASSTYVLQNDPSTGARRFWLQDGEDGGVYLVWTTPVSPLTAAAVLGGAVSGAAIGPNGKIDLSDPNLVVDPDAPGAGLSSMAAGQNASFIASTINGAVNDAGAGLNGANSARTFECANGSKGVNVWGSLGAESGDYGQNEIDSGRAVIGAEKDVSNKLNTACGRIKVGTFLFTSHNEIDQPLLGSDNEANAYGAGLYLKASTDSNFYGSVMGYIGQTDYQGVNAVLESRFDYDSDDWGARLDVGKVMPLNTGNMTADIRGYVGISSSSADSFIDSGDFETTSIDDENISYGASVGLAKPFENNQRVYGRLGVDFSDIDSELIAYDIPVASAPSYTLGRAELGYENSTANGRGTLRIGVNGRLGSEVEAYGSSITAIVRF